MRAAAAAVAAAGRAGDAALRSRRKRPGAGAAARSHAGPGALSLPRPGPAGPHHGGGEVGTLAEGPLCPPRHRGLAGCGPGWGAVPARKDAAWGCCAPGVGLPSPGELSAAVCRHAGRGLRGSPLFLLPIPVRLQKYPLSACRLIPGCCNVMVTGCFAPCSPAEGTEWFSSRMWFRCEQGGEGGCFPQSAGGGAGQEVAAVRRVAPPTERVWQNAGLGSALLVP